MADVVLHLAQTSELAAATGNESFGERFSRFMPADARTVDDGAERAVVAERIHTADIADAVDITLVPTDRLWHIARLAWRTLPYAFARAGEVLHGPIAIELTGPSSRSFADQVWSSVSSRPAGSIRPRPT